MRRVFVVVVVIIVVVAVVHVVFLADAYGSFSFDAMGGEYSIAYHG